MLLSIVGTCSVEATARPISLPAPAARLPGVSGSSRQTPALPCPHFCSEIIPSIFSPSISSRVMVKETPTVRSPVFATTRTVLGWRDVKGDSGGYGQITST
ncbi:hypothetical protein N656DRAFT_163311 [Canariomyces notabilis]|uniref:Uncharacterized protein n=1 Tax=Canariomyces notabilis TaxID=2074819 RepID=A0AAN6TBT4_9PEZI|nr:hypothetical protein N656DRAFT_163311 [Canariomyces arenarius]